MPNFAGGNGTFINDPQNPGVSLTGFGNLQGSGPVLPSASATFSLATVSGQSTITGASLSMTCGVTGAATYSLTLTTPGSPLVLSCPHMAAPGTMATVTAQNSFAAVSSLALTLTAAGTANSSTDTMTLGALSAQLQVPSSGCSSTVSPGGQAFGPGGGNGTISITAAAGCAWGAFDVPNWDFITRGGSGTGNGVVSYQVFPNGGADQTATMTVTNVPFVVEQEGAVAGLNLSGRWRTLRRKRTGLRRSRWSIRAWLQRRRGLSLFGDPSGGR